MLALPASALALSTAVPGRAADTPAAGTSLHLRVTPQRLQYNHPVTATGRSPASAAGHTVQLQAAVSRGSRWQTLRSARIDRSGGFRLRAALRHSGYVRVAALPAGPVASAATVAGAATAGASVSPSRPVAVAARLQVPSRSRELLTGQAVKVRGTLLPAHAGRLVRLQGYTGTGWHTLTSTRTGPAGGFQLHSTPGNGLERRLRVKFPGDATNASTARSAGRVTVYQDQSVASWYEDSGATACGFHAGMGVANRDLPCGTKVRLRYGGRSVTAVVDDRGPFVGGRDWDLNQNTAAALNFGGVGTVWATR
jgi:hypothetical protein